MTSTRYYFHRIARAFGVQSRNQRMSEAAGETHLLREAEVQLGIVVWQRVEHIETLSADYWNLRKLSKEHGTLTEKLSTYQERLQKAHGERAELFNVSSDPEIHLNGERAELIVKLNNLAIRRDEIASAAKEIRRSHDGLKVKSEVLTSQPPETTRDDLESIRSSLAKLKGRFEELKVERLSIANEMEAGDKRINEINEQVKKLKKGQYELASKAFQLIGDVNKNISALRAEINILDTRMAQLHGVIGRHVSRNASSDPACAEAVKGSQGLVEVMRALRKSIILNHKLAEM